MRKVNSFLLPPPQKKRKMSQILNHKSVLWRLQRRYLPQQVNRHWTLVLIYPMLWKQKLFRHWRLKTVAFLCDQVTISQICFLPCFLTLLLLEVFKWEKQRLSTWDNAWTGTLLMQLVNQMYICIHLTRV